VTIAYVGTHGYSKVFSISGAAPAGCREAADHSQYPSSGSGCVTGTAQLQGLLGPYTVLYKVPLNVCKCKLKGHPVSRQKIFISSPKIFIFSPKYQKGDPQKKI
jgi:hypothetical protein